MASPSLRLIELTIVFPARIWGRLQALQREESIIMGRRGNIRFCHHQIQKFYHLGSASSSPSSILTSRICAPPSTCSCAMLSASSYFFHGSGVQNVWSHLHWCVHHVHKFFSRSLQNSRPVKLFFCFRNNSSAGVFRNFGEARIWSGVVPQQPPIILTKPWCAKSWRWPA